MLPVIAIVGRPNVGKSTLFNCVTRTRDALVADEPGLTRDRQYGVGRVGGRSYLVVDTGGLEDEGEMAHLVSHQALRAVEEAHVVLFMVDARGGLTAADEDIAARLRGFGRPTLLVLNKTDGLQTELAATEFHALGMGDPLPLAAAHGRGVRRLMEAACALLPEDAGDSSPPGDGVAVAVLGRPNVGKSTLVNRLLGEERVLTCDSPGTTRDSIYVPFERFGRRYTLIDTAGVRRRARVSERLEKFSVIKSMQAVEAANVVVFLLDGRTGVTDQDATLLGFAVETGRALVLAVNKWDGLDAEQRSRVRDGVARRLSFADFANLHVISALHGSGVGKLFDSVDAAWTAASRKLATPDLTRVLNEAVQAHSPPMVRGRRIKLRYAHQGGQNPPVVVIHGNQTAEVPPSYRRYLVRRFRETFDLHGTPVRVEFRTGDNPYEGRRNTLTPRQVRRKKRMMRHVKKR